MRLVAASGATLSQILDDTYPVWGEGLTRRAYEQWNVAQQQTAWGRSHLTRVALMDEDRALASAKRYDFTMRVEGEVVRALGIGAVFTPKSLRGRGHAGALIAALEDAARADGARVAILFSEIGAGFYERRGYFAVPLQTVDLEVARGQGAPAVLVRSGDERDAVNVAAMHAARAERFRVALMPDASQVIFSVAKKRMFVALHPNRRRRIEYFVTEEGHQAVAFLLLYVSSEGPGAPEVWSLEACGDRDPSGARVGAMLQVLIARNPAAPPVVIRGWWPTSMKPPQLRLLERPPAGEVMMMKSLAPDLKIARLAASDVLYFHGDAF